MGYDLILRDPVQYSAMSFLSFKKSMSQLEGVFEVSFSKVKNKDLGPILVYSVLRDFSMDNKILFQRNKGLAGKKIFRLSSKIKGRKVFFFLDFFLHLIIRGLKRRYIVLKTSQTANGILNFRFSSLSELEVDDYFFFDLYDWSGLLNVFLKYSSNEKLNMLFSLYFKNVFNLNKLLKYEVFSGKG
jgi:hypothetical protein